MMTDPFLHLWSLSVEEQFYLIWPFVVLVTDRRTFPFILVGTIIGSGIFRVGIDQLVPQIVSVRYLTPSCLDALAIGGLVAYVADERGPAGVRRLSTLCGWVSVIGLVVCVFPLARVIDRNVADRFGHTFLVLFYGALVARASQGFEGYPGKLLALTPLRYLGRISYGLYVYHYFAPLLVHRFARSFGYESLLQEKAVAISAYALFTLAAAAVSWHLYEHPINNWKRYFSYPRPAPLAAAPTTAAAYP
jgi:peptidoglycan/LPS O-acetylase OafA/YrhL